MPEPREGDQIVVVDTKNGARVGGVHISLLRIVKGSAVLQIRQEPVEVQRNVAVDDAPPPAVGFG